MEADAAGSLPAGGATAGAPVPTEATSELVATKLAPPFSVPGLLARPGLVGQMSAAPGNFALISAPAGWGKSSLVAAWYAATADERSFAFLTLEPDDDDGPLFWAYVLAALRTVRPELMAGADVALRTAGMDPMRGVIPRLVNELSEIDDRIVLVLDDYHTISQPAIHDSVLFLIDHLPPCLSVVICARSDPPLPLGRLRASGAMIELRAGQLALSVDETAQLLSTRFGVDLDADSLEELHRRAEGWPAGLQLAGISLRTEADPRAFVERFTGEDRNVADYLTSEVLERLPASRREFLLRTSVLDRLSGALCDEVAGVSRAQETLEDLERSNLFVIPLDSRRGWYRYHHLLQEWLQHELRREDPAAIARLMIAASRWHAERGSVEAAVRYAGNAGDLELAGDLIDRYVTDWSNVNWSQLDRWFELLPDEVMAHHPIAVTARVWMAMVKGDMAGAARWIDAAAAGVESVPPDLRPTAATMAGLFRAAVDFVDGDMDSARVKAKAYADELAGPGSTMVQPLRSVMFAGAVGVHALSTFWTVGAREAIPLLREAVITREEASIPDHGFTPVLALALSEVGDWDATEVAATAAFALPRQFDQYRWPDLMAAHYALGRVLVARGDRQAAVDEIRTGVAMARDFGWPIFTAYGCLVLADAVDDYVEKRALVREARELIDASDDPGRVPDLVAAMERKLSIRRPAAAPGAVFVERLTDRELEALRLLRTDLSLREIANELYISHNTIKGYTKSIYRKLGVSSRESAIETARELDLI